MVHLRTHLTVRIRRSALAAALPAQLETGAVLVRAPPQGRAFICDLRPQHPLSSEHNTLRKPVITHSVSRVEQKRKLRNQSEAVVLSLAFFGRGILSHA